MATSCTTDGGLASYDPDPFAFGRAMRDSIMASGAKGTDLVGLMRRTLVPITTPMDLGSVITEVVAMTSQLMHNASTARPEEWGANTALMGVRYHAAYAPFIERALEEVGKDSALGHVQERFLAAYEQAAKAAGLQSGVPKAA
ncbi:MAG: hypothetical protein Q7S65_00815 [Nanoarchaeota archaeon]|nr:hypothetical protein [Nanoarchaeota archaeon]